MVEEKGLWVLPVGLIIIGALFFVGITGFDLVPANHLGVKERMGVIKGAMEPGYAWTGLFTSVHDYDLRTRKDVIELQGAQGAVDNTGQAVYATININYRIKPTHDTVINLFTKVGRDRVISDRLNIDAIVREGFKQATAKYEAMDILNKRQEVKELAKENIKANFPSQYFEVQDIIITNIDFGEGFKQAIENKKIATQNKLEEKEILEVVKLQQEQEIEKYKAEAEKLRLQKTQVTALLNQQKWIDAWDGQLPQFMIVGQEQANMLLQLPDFKEQSVAIDSGGEEQ